MGPKHGKTKKPSYSDRGRQLNLKQLCISPSAISIVHHSIDEIRDRRLRPRVVENFLIIWLDASIGEHHGDIKYTIDQLQTIVNTVRTFTDVPQCLSFIRSIHEERIFLVTSGRLSGEILPMVANLVQIDSVYVFCWDKSQYKALAKQYHKVKGIFQKVEAICERIREDLRRGEYSLMPMSFLSPDHVDDSNQSFIFSELLKEVLLEYPYDDRAKSELVTFCLQQYDGNSRELSIINEFEARYDQPSPIWWYTRECFTYSMINKALRANDIEVIIRMGFFIRDIHRQIESLHRQANIQEPFVVFRGQALSLEELQKMRFNRGDLFSFNGFLSTSVCRNVALVYAQRALRNPDVCAVLFEMTIDPRQSTTPFASVDHVSYYSNEEQEVLFSIHSVFRIGRSEELEDRLWQVKLTLVSDQDEQVRTFHRYLERTMDLGSGFDRLGTLLIQMGRYEKAEEIYSLLLDETPFDHQDALAIYYHQLGLINDRRDNRLAAKSHYEYALQAASDDHPLFSTIQMHLGLILRKQGNRSGAVKALQRALDNESAKLRSNPMIIGQACLNLGLILKEQGHYRNAIERFESALRKFDDPPASSPIDAIKTCKYLGETFDLSNDKLTALTYYEKARDAEEKMVPLNYSSLDETCYSMAVLLESLRRYDEAVEQIRKALNFLRADPHRDERLIEIRSNYLEQLLSNIDEHHHSPPDEGTFSSD